MDQYIFVTSFVCLLIAFLELLLNQKWIKFFLNSGIFFTSKEINVSSLDIDRIRENAKGTQYSKIEFKELNNEVYLRTNLKHYFSNRGSVFLKLTTGKIVFDRRSKKYKLKIRLIWLPFFALLANFIVDFQVRQGHRLQTLVFSIIVIAVVFFIGRIFYKRYLDGLVAILHQS